MKQFVVTTAMGKRLIAKGMAAHPDIQQVLEKGMLVIIAGSTNGYVAEEILKSIGQADGFSRVGFRRGLTTAPGAKLAKADLQGDVVIVDGQWHKGELITDVANDLKTGDIVHELRIEGVVEELYDVCVLAGVKRPMAIGFVNEEIRHTLSLPN